MAAVPESIARMPAPDVRRSLALARSRRSREREEGRATFARVAGIGGRLGGAAMMGALGLPRVKVGGVVRLSAPVGLAGAIISVVAPSALGQAIGGAMAVGLELGLYETVTERRPLAFSAAEQTLRAFLSSGE